LDRDEVNGHHLQYATALYIYVVLKLLHGQHEDKVYQTLLQIVVELTDFKQDHFHFMQAQLKRVLKY